MVDILSVAAEIRRGKKKIDHYIFALRFLSSAILHRATIINKPPGSLLFGNINAKP